MTSTVSTADPVGTSTGLEVRGLSVFYGGHHAVEAVSLDAPVGRITGLIGPNGAGKTTIFNASSGLVRPAAGSVSLFGREITSYSPSRRAHAGLGRSFQRVQVCEGLSARDNVAVGREARLIGANFLRQIWARSGERRLIAESTDAALEICGIGDLADRPASVLSTGQRRLVELARVVAGGFRVLLLDEPSSGLDDAETRRFGDVLERIVRELDVGVLLVEHDMGLVMRTCAYLYVLDFGRLIFEGTPAEAQVSEAVRAAYLGNDEVVGPVRLELDDVTAAYGEAIVLRNVRLVVPEGSVVALLGPNGAGKTTLLSVASGLLRPRAGRVLLGRQDVTDVPADERGRRGLCHITEGRAIYPALTVADNLRMFASRTDEHEGIERAVSAFPILGSRLRQVAGTMSGGEQQMLALGRAYAQRPALVLLDEVSMGLAPMVVDRIFEFLDLLKAEGTSMLVVEQYVARASRLADYVYLLAKGQLVLAATPGELAGNDVFSRYLGSEVGQPATTPG